MMNLRKNTLPTFRSSNDLWKIMDDIFSEDLPMQRNKFTPVISVTENAEAYFIDAELPGIAKDDIEISIHDNTLFLKGEKKSNKDETYKGFHYEERTFGSFYRSIPLAKDADVEKVKADMNNGLLSIEISKFDQQTAQRRTINIG